MARLTEARKVVTATPAYRGSFESITLAADLVLTAKSASVLRIDPTAARNVDLPGAAGEVLEEGEYIRLINVGAGVENLTVRLTGGGATVVTVTPGDYADVYYDGSTWALVALITDGVS